MIYLRQIKTGHYWDYVSCYHIIFRVDDNNSFTFFVVVLLPMQADACPDCNQHASLHHSVAMVLLSRLLPGSEYLAHELLRGFAFNPQLIP